RYMMKEDVRDKRILVAGLGLIGGSIALALKRAGYAVYGWNRSKGPLDYALAHGVVDGGLDASEADIIFLCLPPKACVDFADTHGIKKGAYVFDICGVKGYMEERMYEKERPFFYVGLHPMAGKEVSGVENADAALFDKASMVITSSKKTDPEAYAAAKLLTKDMGFKRIVECSAKVHDEKIAYTSQLAHVVSNAYVKNGKIAGCFGFTGGSFQDMTRIAGVDEKVWSELFLLNGDNLVRDIELLRSSLGKISDAVKSGDKENLERVLAEGRKLFQDGKDTEPSDGIKITELK
ncbi:MAG: prephenate dehydrogenase, partial [Clostridia bacterium]|nr:prephenate dehydrogenase [Clostridia bacterium]